MALKKHTINFVISVRNIVSNKVLTLDLETTGLDWQTDKILLIGYSFDASSESDFMKGVIQFVPGDEDNEIFREWLKDPEVIKRGHNIKFDILFLINNGYEVNGTFDCTSVLSYLEDPFRPNGLKFLVQNKLGKKVQHIEELLEQTKIDLGLKKNRIVPFEKISIDLWKPYNADDVINCDELRTTLNETPWYTNVEQPLINILTRMESRGILLDRNHLETLKNEYDQKLQDLQSQLGSLNPRSPKQVSEMLISSGVSLKEKTKAGKPKSDKLVLKKLAWGGSSEAQVLLEYRSISKLQTTYVMPLLQKSSIDGRIHGSFNQAGSEGGSGGTKTGRLTSSGPNLQNIPSRTKEGNSIRKSFIPTPGMIMIDSDLKQIEPRLVAHYTQNKFLLEAYAKGEDTHAIMGGIVFNKDPKTLTKLERFIGKTCWLADFYGCSAKKLKVICETISQDELPYDEAYYVSVKKSLERGNPQLYSWRRQHIEETRKIGYVLTIGGRTIKIPNLYSKNMLERFAAEREAINYQIQGSAADVFKTITIKLDEFVRDKGYLLAFCHDEWLAEIFERFVTEQFKVDFKNVVCNTINLSNVGIDTDIKLVSSWADK